MSTLERLSADGALHSPEFAKGGGVGCWQHLLTCPADYLWDVARGSVSKPIPGSPSTKLFSTCGSFAPSSCRPGCASPEEENHSEATNHFIPQICNYSMSLKAKPFPTTEIKEGSPNPSLPSGTDILYSSASLPLHLCKSHWKTSPLLPRRGLRILFWLPSCDLGH